MYLNRLNVSAQSVCVQVQLVTGVALDRHLSVTVNAPSGLIVGRADDASGQIVFSVEETGESHLDMCFSTFAARKIICFFFQSGFHADHAVNARQNNSPKFKINVVPNVYVFL